MELNVFHLVRQKCCGLYKDIGCEDFIQRVFYEFLEFLFASIQVLHYVVSCLLLITYFAYFTLFL